METFSLLLRDRWTKNQLPNRTTERCDYSQGHSLRIKSFSGTSFPHTARCCVIGLSTHSVPVTPGPGARDRTISATAMDYEIDVGHICSRPVFACCSVYRTLSAAKKMRFSKKPNRICSVRLFSSCLRSGSNRHFRRNWILSPARLPIPPQRPT